MKKKLLYILLLLYSIISVFVIFHFDGTGDAGDSVLHFLYAKHAVDHPELYFNHWAKPFFVLLASPFAQFGLVGIKFFNVLIMLLTMFFTFKMAEELKLKNALLSIVFIVFSPLVFILTFSGLTEPLFALIISVSLYGFLKNKYVSASLLISFLPFVRSEGLIIIAVFGAYLLLKRKWKYIALLSFGHLVYSVVGFWAHKDILWVFNKIPYSKLSSSYGNGSLFHFVEQLLYVVGVPIYILFWVGFLVLTWEGLKKKFNLELHLLIFLSFLTFFSAHSLFWYFGIFNSMGLKRVLIGVIPLISIVSLIGFNFLTENLLGNKKQFSLIFKISLTSYILIFPFTDNPSAVDWKRNLSLSIEQKKANEIAIFLNDSINYKHRIFYAHPYLSQALNLDHFDNTKRINLSLNYKREIKKGDIIIWDYWFSVVEEAVQKKELDSNRNLKKFYAEWNQDEEILFSIYEVVSGD